MTSGPSYSVKTNINPSSFRGPIELFDLSQLNELVKFMGFNKVMPVITKLHMKKHSRRTKSNFHASCTFIHPRPFYGVLHGLDWSCNTISDTNLRDWLRDMLNYLSNSPRRKVDRHIFTPWKTDVKRSEWCREDWWWGVHLRTLYKFCFQMVKITR